MSSRKEVSKMEALFFEDEAANVYRTKHFIVEQVLCLKDDNSGTATNMQNTTILPSLAVILTETYPQRRTTDLNFRK